ncbi:IS3 family transposase [Candidatus Saccharibacteria bacterium]|nr:IS3 family transposase [Candidatus Saccharibacteria bacterium]
MYKKISEDSKQRLARRYQAGESAAKICRESSIPRSTLYYWAKIYRMQVAKTGGTATPKELDSARRRLKKYEDMICVLKSVDCTATAPMSYRLKALEPLYGQYNIHILCEALDVSRGTFYNHIRRNKRDKTWYNQRRSTLMAAVQAAYDNSNQIYGAGKIRAVLVNAGYTISLKYVSELMREMGLSSISVNAKKNGRALAQITKKTNVLKQNFDVDRPNKVWASDITCYRFKDTVLHICVFIDLFSRKVVSHSIGKNSSTYLVKTAFMAAYQDRRPTDLLIHTDRGTAYTSYSMHKTLKKNSIAQSFSQAGKPYDNAVIESFFASFKKEELYRANYRSEAELRASTSKYINFYNTERIHRYLCNRTPDQVEAEFRQSSGL